jgi:protein-disulfide isomerase
MEAYETDEEVAAFAADAAVRALSERLRALRAQPARSAEAGGVRLEPPLSLTRDHIEGPVTAPRTLVVFGEFGTPASRSLGKLMEALRAAHPASLRIAWRHLPDAVAHPRAAALALAAEAAAAQARFWSMTRELLALRHEDPADVHAAALRADVDFDRLVESMGAGAGADRIVADVESALRSAVASPPARFVNGERYRGALDAPAVSGALRTTADVVRQPPNTCDDSTPRRPAGRRHDSE